MAAVKKTNKQMNNRGKYVKSVLEHTGICTCEMCHQGRTYNYSNRVRKIIEDDDDEDYKHVNNLQSPQIEQEIINNNGENSYDMEIGGQSSYDMEVGGHDLVINQENEKNCDHLDRNLHELGDVALALVSLGEDPLSAGNEIQHLQSGNANNTVANENESARFGGIVQRDRAVVGSVNKRPACVISSGEEYGQYFFSRWLASTYDMYMTTDTVPVNERRPLLTYRQLQENVSLFRKFKQSYTRKKNIALRRSERNSAR